jgi:hypothetical protein
MKRTLIIVFIFSIAMGFMESAVVVYLRALYYPAGFQFPLTVIPNDIARVEIFREAATLVMLIAIGLLSGKNTFEKFCFFLFSFATWDLFYYVFLKIFLDWPESIFTWDILFLIPFPWTGPVLAPCILSLTMILLTLLMFYNHRKSKFISPSRREWWLLILGSLIVIATFVYDYLSVASSSTNEQMLFENFKTYVPGKYNWMLFWIGEFVTMLGMYSIFFSRKAWNQVERERK